MSESAAKPVAMRRRARFLSLRIAVAAIIVGSTTGIQSVAADEAPAEFRALLLDSGFSADELAAFNNWNGRLSEAQAEVAARLLFRLRAADSDRFQVPAFLYGDVEANLKSGRKLEPEPGQLFDVEGSVVSATPIELPAVAQEVFETKQLTQCNVKLPGGAVATVLARQVPAAWSRRPLGTSLDDPVKLRGVFLGVASIGDAPQPLVLAERLQWRPEANVSFGIAWLARHGFDAALLDEVRHGQRFAKPSESLEAKAFYECLAAIAQGESAELASLVRDRLPAAAKVATNAADDAARRRREIILQLESAPPDRRKTLQAELAEVRRRQALASQVAARAKRGLSSTWPMILEPAQSTGDLFLIEGTARRAVRIVVEEPPAGTVSSNGARDSSNPSSALREYYELDVFTTDFQSQPAYRNQPVICCVARLPEGFPTGEVIREPVRVAGVFFKKWAYARRSDNLEAKATGDGRPVRLAPPLMIASEPEWLRASEATGVSFRGLWGGVAFLGVAVLLWIVLARVSRRDQLARARRARYDAPLDKLAEP